MRVGKNLLVGVLALLGLAASAQADPIIQILSNNGVWRVTTPTINTSVSVANPYGTAPVPIITPITSGWMVTFAPSADFLAAATNDFGGERQIFDGNLSFYVTFDAPISLTTNIYEDGIYTTAGNGTVKVTGGVIVSEADNSVPLETHGNLFPSANFANNGLWNLYDQVTGFNGSYSRYKISLDNILEGQSLPSQSHGDALIAKKDFTIIFTTDGSSGGGPIPEPASLSVLALGGLALLARRRKV